ncbi:hypothetical protein FA95DRAFT_1676783 [Auriscalpium vulgare]|uniref:Uncharacterized protein n=1 Tax=Auriscalpium vulgare TaxID=40419 RepID=A0ACB8S2V3_9AGAM|nr:hypothetical protein FA95DRAFT_1676783 [Auriscalpium vulgare]
MEYFNRRPRSLVATRSRTACDDVSPAPSDIDSIPDHSIYIFPSAPAGSAPPSPLANPPPAGAHVDDRRDASTSQSSDVGSGSGWDELASPLDLSGASSPADEPHSIELLDWAFEDGEDGVEVDESVLEEEIVRASRWDLVPRRSVYTHDPGPVRYWLHTDSRTRGSGLQAVGTQRPHPTMVYRSRTHSAASAPPGPAPHPRIRLPLLSFFASLLAIDESTLHLIAHTPSHSVLFVGPVPALEEKPDPRDEDERAHGVVALLAPPEEKTSLRDGLRVACDPDLVFASPFVPFPLGALCDLVKGVWVGGGKALREVWQ